MSMLDTETNLEIGDPDKLPFENAQEIDLLQLQENIEKRIRFGIASASGIRQVFDSTCGDEATDSVDSTGTEITDAAKVHVATIADCFVDLLREQTGRSRPTVVVAIDSRHTGPTIADTVVRLLAFHGVNIIYTFVTPVTEAAVYSREVSDGFIYISASHNPKGYNGFKLGMNDGRVLPRHLALPFIGKYQTRLRDRENTKAIIHKVNTAKPETIREVYNQIDRCRKESRDVYARFSDQMITGLRDPQEAAQRKELLRKEIQAKELWIGLDPNGGARKDKEYLESWGFHVLEINSRPRLDMVHDLAPNPTACEQAKEALIKAQKERKNIIAFLVFDTDGDRKNIVIPDGKGGAAVPGVQMIFTLDVLCSILDARWSMLDAGYQNRALGVVVNGPTSSVMEQLTRYLDFTIRRVEVGEANVATAGMLLHEQGMDVPIMGEGSNGSVFNLHLLVREPLHTVRTLVNLITRPELTRMLVNRFRMEDNYDGWYSPENISSLLMNIINILPPSVTTDFFTGEGIRRSKFHLPQGLFRANFDAYFGSLLPRVIEEIKHSYGGQPMAELVDYQGENELRGKGDTENGTGGHKVEFYVRTQEGDKRHIGWIWFRPSGTERGVMRRGVSISHWDTSNPQAAKVVDRVYKYMDSVFADALDIVEERTLTMCPDQPTELC